jgi:lysophospholipase L1-like esterase
MKSMIPTGRFHLEMKPTGMYYALARHEEAPMSQSVHTPQAELHDPDVLAPSEADALLAGAPWERFVVVGDSIAEGLGEPVDGYADTTWAQRLTAVLRRVQPDLEYTNLGRRYLQVGEIRDSQIGPALALRPDLVALVAGGNDLLVPQFELAPVAVTFEEIVAPLAATGATVVTYTMMNLPSAFPSAAMDELERRLGLLNGAVREISERYGALLVDLESLAVCSDPGIYSSDLRHGNMRGQAIAASATIRRLGEHLREG